jgi:hypothetical protein
VAYARGVRRQPTAGEPLTQQQFVAILDQWVDSEVAVRVVSDRDDLVGVFRGRLGGRSAGKPPALFWPLRTPGDSEHLELPGIYMHPESFLEASAHEGKFVLELRQAGVTLNVRRL